MALPLYLQHLLLTKLESKKYIIKWKGLSYLHCTCYIHWLFCYFTTFYSFLCSLLFYHYFC